MFTTGFHFWTTPQPLTQRLEESSELRTLFLYLAAHFPHNGSGGLICLITETLPGNRQQLLGVYVVDHIDRLVLG